MAGFSASDAAFEGFRLTREQPKAIAVWAGLSLIFSLLAGSTFVGLAGGAMETLTSFTPESDTDPTEIFGLMGRLAPVGLLVLVLSLAFYGVLYAAVNRAALRPSEGGFGFVKFGRQEVQQMVALLLTYLLLFAVYIVLIVASLILAGIAGAALGGAGAVIGTLLAIVVIVAGLAFFLVRFSLVSPLTFGRDRVQVLESWRVTKGHFWPLLGAFVLALVLVVVVYLLGLMIFTALAGLLLGGLGAIGQAFSPDYSSVGAYFTPAVLLYTVVTSILTGLGFAIIGGTAASAYRQITGDGDNIGETFA